MRYIAPSALRPGDVVVSYHVVRVEHGFWALRVYLARAAGSPPDHYVSFWLPRTWRVRTARPSLLQRLAARAGG